MTPEAIDIVKHFESLHDGDLKKAGLQAKLCPTGYVTMGYGRVILHPVTHKQLKGEEGLKIANKLYPAISIETAEQWLVEDLSRFDAIVRALVTFPLSEVQISALVSLCYNIGQGNFQRSTLLKRLNFGKLAEAAEQFAVWCRGTVNGKSTVLNGLVRRRATEAHYFLTGEVKYK